MNSKDKQVENCDCAIEDNNKISKNQLNGVNHDTFLLENLNCANCANKIEAKINQIDTVEHANVVFSTKQLHIRAQNIEELIPQIQEICTSFEDEIVVKRKKTIPTQVAIYTLMNLECANCASKIENDLNELDVVNEATITFATKRLKIVSKRQLEVETIREICHKYEEEIEVVSKGETIQNEDSKKDLYTLLIGSILFILSILLSMIDGFNSNSFIMMSIYIASYLTLGSGVLLTALKNMKKGLIFDENFLMSVATLGAFVIAEYSEAVGVMLFFRVGSYFEHIAVERSRKQIMEAINLHADVVTLIKGENEEVIATEDVKVNDVLLIKVGDKIALDGTVIDGESYLDTSAINGEPVLMKVEKGSKVLSGYMNTSGVIMMRVDKVLEDSLVSKILESVENAAANKPKIDHFISRFARIYTPIVVAIAIFTAIGMPIILQEEFYPWIYTALSFLVMSCPCALVLSVPLAYFCGIGAGSKRGILFKGGVVLEGLAKIKAVVLDKTGTVTKGNFVVQEINVFTELSETEVLSYVGAAEKHSNHPIAKSILNKVQENKVSVVKVSQLSEISGKGVKAEINDKILLCGNEALMKEFNIDLKKRSEVVVGSEVLVAYENQLIAQIIISDTVKDEAASAISRINKSGIVSAMLTGDNEISANQIAKSVNISDVRSSLLPTEKYEELQKIREKYGSTMFVGDGINDAVVLAGADVGAAMGSGSDVAIEAADIVFMNSNVDAIATSIEISKKTTSIAKQNVIGAIAIKIVVMILGLTGIYSNMWLAVFADTGVAFICILNSIRILYKKYQ